MKNFFAIILFALTLGFGFSWGPSLVLAADEVHCVRSVSVKVDCPVTLPEGDLETRGKIAMELDKWVELCYPAVDWESQKERPGQRPYYVSLSVVGEPGVLRGIPRFQSYEDMADAKLITSRCYRQYYRPGWAVMTVTQCRREGFYVFLTTRLLTAADHTKTIYFDGRPELDGYAYRVRQ